MYGEALKYYENTYLPTYKYLQHLIFMQKNIKNYEIYNSINKK